MISSSARKLRLPVLKLAVWLTLLVSLRAAPPVLEPSAPPVLPSDHRFAHPGTLNALADLEFVRDRIRAGAQPWLGAYERLKREPVAQLGFQPRAYSVVFTDVLAPDFDPTTTNAQNLSAHAAYAHALRWFFEGRPEHAAAARSVLRLWATTLRRHEGEPNAGLQAAWVAPVFVRAAEILRATDPQWSPDDHGGCSRLLREVFLPLVVNGAPTTAGNWELSFTEAVLSIAAFTEDRALFDRGLTLLHHRLQNYFYLETDGPHPVMPTPRPGWTYPKWSQDLFVIYQTEAGRRDYWYMKPGDRFHPGQCQETGRDLLHVQMGSAAAANALEIARTQGLDLFAAYGPRLAAGLEFNASFLLGAKVPADLNGGVLKWADKREAAWEIATLRIRQATGLELPLSSRIVAEHRAVPPPAKLHMAWETLTHADLLTGNWINPGRLINLSVLTSIAASDNFTFGFVVGGAGTSGNKPLLMRAAGPSLTQLGVTGVLADPVMEFYNGSNKASENNDWAADSAVMSTAAAVGAFPYAGATSKDAAIYLSSVPSGNNSVLIKGVGTSSGTVMAELYDATPNAQFGATTPRLVNVSVLKNIGMSITVGFVVGGSSSVRVLVRAVGPTLGVAPFGVPGVIADPKLTLFGEGGAALASNDDWAGAAALSAAFGQVGAFILPAASKDAAVLQTLAPGNYTVQVSPSSGATGVALVEVYEVP